MYIFKFFVNLSRAVIKLGNNRLIVKKNYRNNPLSYDNCGGKILFEVTGVIGLNRRNHPYS